jgi:hypothetical protein
MKSITLHDWASLLLRGALTITALLALFSYLGILR